MPKEAIPSPNQNEILKALENLRSKLLDLTAHNPLLNYHHGRSSRYIRVVDELPGQIVKTLLDGKPMRFAPVPKLGELELEAWKRQQGVARNPTPEEWAEQIGIDGSYDMPKPSTIGAKKGHADRILQTIHFPDQLESRLANISRLARTSIEETGVNMLHLIVGMLEWYEDDQSDQSRLAPLIAIPVILSKGNLQPETQTYEYEVKYSGEDCQDNVSLAARLEQDFSYKLPTLPEEFTVEDYLGRIGRSITKKFPRWRVRRYATIGFLNFGKLLMYRDLDPKRWPESRKLEANPLVRAVVAGAQEMDKKGGDGMATAFEAEYRIDQIDEIYETYPIIDKADSSQHSALIDAVNGKNLVIEGPPGTGKSQTITNLIAAAMNAGKSVLFVSEKLAALEVVKQRLDRLGLGLYCLELHSHATQKASVIESLKRRIDAHKPGSPTDYDKGIDRHRKLRDNLGAHAELVNSVWNSTGLTIHQILVGATRLAEELPAALRDVIDPSRDTSGWSQEVLEEIVQEARAFQAFVANVVVELEGQAIGVAHPWRGIGTSAIPVAQHPQLIGLLRAWNNRLELVGELWSEICEISGVGAPSDDLEEMLEAPGEVRLLPDRREAVAWHALSWATDGGHEQLDELVRGWAEILEYIESEEAAIDPVILAGLNPENGIQLVRELLEAGFSDKSTLDAILELSPGTELARRHAMAFAGYFSDYSSGAQQPLPDELAPEGTSLKAISQVSSLLHHLRGIGSASFDFRCKDWVDAKVILALKKVVDRIGALQAARTLLSVLFDFNMINDAADIPSLMLALSDAGIIKRLLSPKYRRARTAACAFVVGGKKGFVWQQIIAQLDLLQRHLAEVSAFVAATDAAGLPTGTLWKGIDTDKNLLSLLIDWHAWILDHHTSVSGGLFPKTEIDGFGRWQLACPVQDLERLMAFDGVDFDGKCQHIVDLVDRLEKLRASSTRRIIDPDAQLVSTGESGSINRVHGLLKGAQELAEIPGILRKWPLRRIEQRLREFDCAKRKLRDWLDKVAALNERVFSGSLPVTPEDAHITASVMNATGVFGAQLAAFPPQSVVRQACVRSPREETVEWLRDWARQMEDCRVQQTQARDTFAEMSNLNAEEWGADVKTLNVLLNRNASAVGHPEMLPGYLRLLAFRELLGRFGLKHLAGQIEANCHDPESIGKACRHALLRGLSNAIIEMEPKMNTFAGSRQEQIRSDFQKIDEELLSLTRKKVAAAVARRPIPSGVRGVLVKDHTELELLNHEANKQRSHLPIRQLLKRAGHAAKALKPCFMMGPRSVAQYLDPGGLAFDLLVIDEASQMKPADAIGAIARVDQLVVVGDPKQLPPTSFFDRLNTGDEDEDAFAIGTSESILDAMIPIFAARRLRWHYRSRHESLIAFSNRNFYDNHLLLFPSPGGSDGRLGLVFRRVADGRFTNQVNEPEAIAVAKRVEELLCEDPSMSLGVATMSAKQRDYVEGVIDSLAKGNPVFNRALSKNKERYEKLFVKNLETVQGDERSVMLISCTYGPDQPEGRVYQRFGPINAEVGWRRLNVLFTRARERMEVFSSMVSGDIIVDGTSSRGVGALKQFLDYAETKNLKSAVLTDRPPDSDFEIAVAKILNEQGFECDYQVGVAGFFIDLGVKHPRRPGEYVMGIECDGATYHAAKSVRDRDRLRQEILESLGWKIRRIWSTDWFANPRGTLAPILKELQASR